MKKKKGEREGKVPDVSNLATKTPLTTAEKKIPNSNIQVFKICNK